MRVFSISENIKFIEIELAAFSISENIKFIEIEMAAFLSVM